MSPTCIHAPAFHPSILPSIHPSFHQFIHPSILFLLLCLAFCYVYIVNLSKLFIFFYTPFVCRLPPPTPPTPTPTLLPFMLRTVTLPMGTCSQQIACSISLADWRCACVCNNYFAEIHHRCRLIATMANIHGMNRTTTTTHPTQRKFSQNYKLILTVLCAISVSFFADMEAIGHVYV